MSLTPIPWPIGVPQRPRRDGFQIILPSPVLRSAMDVGAKQRRITTFAPPRWSVSFNWRASELSAFRIFLSGAAAGGAVPVMWTDPVTGQVRAVRIVGAEDLVVAPHPQMAGRWIAAMTFEAIAT